MPETPKHKFEFSIDGEGVSPSTVGLRDLVEILHAFESVVAMTAVAQGAKEAADIQLHLVGVSAGSDTLTLLAGDRMYKASKTVTRAISEDRFDDIPLAAWEGVRRLSKRSKSTGWSFRIAPPRGPSHARNGMAEAKITPQKELLLPNEITGGTTLLAKIDRVGGEHSPTASVYLGHGEKLTVELKNKAMADSLGHCLFKWASLEGTALWDFESWKIKRFRVERIGEYADTPTQEAFQLLSDAAGDRWESVNPEEFVTGLRSEE